MQTICTYFQAHLIAQDYKKHAHAFVKTTRNKLLTQTIHSPIVKGLCTQRRKNLSWKYIVCTQTIVTARNSKPHY